MLRAHAVRSVARLAAVVDALPLQPHFSIPEIKRGSGRGGTCGRCKHVTGHIRAIDRSASTIAQASVAAAEQLASGRTSVRRVAVEGGQSADAGTFHR
jgi:hypothetical protein